MDRPFTRASIRNWLSMAAVMSFFFALEWTEQVFSVQFHCERCRREVGIVYPIQRQSPRGRTRLKSKMAMCVLRAPGSFHLFLCVVCAGRQFPIILFPRRNGSSCNHAKRNSYSWARFEKEIGTKIFLPYWFWLVRPILANQMQALNDDPHRFASVFPLNSDLQLLYEGCILNRTPTMIRS